MSITIEPTVRVETQPPADAAARAPRADLRDRDLDAIYGGKPAIKGVSMEVYKNLVTAIIGPSGCGKSTFIRCFNRMNDLIPSFTQTGTSATTGRTSPASTSTLCRSPAIGMVFQRPNPFPKSIYDNVAWGCRSSA